VKRPGRRGKIMQHHESMVEAGSIRAEDIFVSSTMIEAGLAVLEETDSWPLSRVMVERAFQEMCLCGLRESGHESYYP